VADEVRVDEQWSDEVRVDEQWSDEVRVDEPSPAGVRVNGRAGAPGFSCEAWGVYGGKS